MRRAGSESPPQSNPRSGQHTQRTPAGMADLMNPTSAHHIARSDSRHPYYSPAQYSNTSYYYQEQASPSSRPQQYYSHAHLEGPPSAAQPLAGGLSQKSRSLRPEGDPRVPIPPTHSHGHQHAWRPEQYHPVAEQSYASRTYSDPQYDYYRSPQEYYQRSPPPSGYPDLSPNPQYQPPPQVRMRPSPSHLAGQASEMDYSHHQTGYYPVQASERQIREPYQYEGRSPHSYSSSSYMYQTPYAGPERMVDVSYYGQSAGPSSRTRVRSSARGGMRCASCGTDQTPEWRKGPLGPHTLCNACGLIWAKLVKKKQGAQAQTHSRTGSTVSQPRQARSPMDMSRKGEGADTLPETIPEEDAERPKKFLKTTQSSHTGETVSLEEDKSVKYASRPCPLTRTHSAPGEVSKIPITTMRGGEFPAPEEEVSLKSLSQSRPVSESPPLVSEASSSRLSIANLVTDQGEVAQSRRFSEPTSPHHYRGKTHRLTEIVGRGKQKGRME